MIYHVKKKFHDAFCVSDQL